MTDSYRIVTGFLALVALSAATPAGAQQGYYDRFGNWVEFEPAPVYRAPPPVLRRLPPSDVGPGPYDAPPPVTYYAEPPPPGWVPLPPADIPTVRPSRRLPGGAVEPGYAIEADPDAPYDAPYDGPVEAYESVPPGLTPDAPYYRETRPRLVPPEVPADPGFAVEPQSRPARAIAALGRYAPAKKAAIALQDPFERLAALRSVNAWLVATSIHPATASTIRAVDTLLGLPMAEDSTALPGAGTEIRSPKGEGTLDEDVRRRLADYASTKADARDARDDAERSRLAAKAEGLLKEGGTTLDPAEIAGLDAYLGVDGADAVVARGTAPAPDASVQ